MLFETPTNTDITVGQRPENNSHSPRGERLLEKGVFLKNTHKYPPPF
jgi:hypothetical protein